MVSSIGDLLNPESLVETFGLIGIFVILFVETGLLVGFFLPGDSLLVVAGLASSGPLAATAGAELPLGPLLVGAPFAAIGGAQTGYYLGVTVGSRMFRRPDRARRLHRAERYFARFGPARAIILARFVGIVRTFINPAAGMLGVPAKKFLLYNVIGALVWTDGLILAGYFLGDRLPGDIDSYLLAIVLAIMFVSLLPIVGMILRDRGSNPSPYEPSSGDGSGTSAEGPRTD